MSNYDDPGIVEDVDDDGHDDFDGQVEAVIDHYEQQNHGRAHANRPQSGRPQTAGRERSRPNSGHTHTNRPQRGQEAVDMSNDELLQGLQQAIERRPSQIMSQRPVQPDVSDHGWSGYQHGRKQRPNSAFGRATNGVAPAGTFRPASAHSRPRPQSAAAKVGRGMHGSASTGAIRPQSAAGMMQHTRPQSADGVGATRSRPHSAMPPATAQVQMARARSVQNIRHYMKQKAIKSRKLEADLERGEQELMFDSLYKMGEANEWCEELKIPTRYRIGEASGKNIKVHVFCGDEFEKEISMMSFMKRHRGLRTRRLTCMPPSKEDAAQPNLALGDKKPAKPDIPAYQKAELSPEEQEERAESIRTALLECLQLTNQLKEQLMVLDAKANTFTPFVLE